MYKKTSLLLGLTLTFVLFQNFTPVVNNSARKAEFYMDGNVLIGAVCSNSNVSVQVKRGNETRAIQPAYVQSGQEFQKQSKFIYKSCGQSFSKVNYFSARIPSHFLNNSTWKLNGNSFVPNDLVKSNQKKYGILYHTWHCPVSISKGSSVVFDIYKKLAGLSPSWGPLLWPHWTGKPFDNYYCLKNNTNLIKKHAVLLKNAGVDYIYLDMTNSPVAYENNGQLKQDFKDKIADPTLSILQTYKQLEQQGVAVPKVVPWIGTTKYFQGNAIPYYRSISKWIDTAFWNNSASLRFSDGAKPLLFVKVANKAGFDWQNVKGMVQHPRSKNHKRFNVIPKWGQIDHSFNSAPSNWTGLKKNDVWSFMEKCKTSNGNIVQNCGQRKNTAAKQISVSPAYQTAHMMSSGSVPKRKGRTFYQQFRQSYGNDIRYISITGWNEWIAKRHCHGANRFGTPALPSAPPHNNIAPYRNLTCTGRTSGHSPEFKVFNGKWHPMFVDTYTYDRSRDLEPNRVQSDCYYQLMRYSILSAKDGDSDLTSKEKNQFRSYCGFDLRR
jgi:hypothetical protein